MDKVKKTMKNYALSVIVPLLMILLLLTVSSETRSVKAIISLLRQGFAPAVLGWGVLFNMQVGNWDFSIGARFVLAAILAGNLAMEYQLGVIGMTVLAVVISLGLGMVVGYAYKLLQIPTLIVSIGLCLIFESLTRIIYHGTGVHVASEYMLFGKAPYDLLAFVVCFAIAAWLYYKRKLGYNVRAVGTNPVVAQTNGINAADTKTKALIVSGLFAGLYCVLSLSKSGVCAAVSGTLGSAATVFDAMMCVLIGMAICGKGNIIFALYSGALISQVLKMGMMAIGLPTTYNKVVIAAFVILFMVSSTRADLFASMKEKLFRRREKEQEAVS